MTIKIKNSGVYMSSLNGEPVINNQYAIDIDSERNKSKQVIGMVNNNGIIERTQDTLQNYMQKMSSKNQSIFDILKQEHSHLDKVNNVVDLSNPNSNSIASSNVLKKIKQQKTRKRGNKYNGISSKLFDFTSASANTSVNNTSRKKKRKKRSRKGDVKL